MDQCSLCTEELMQKSPPFSGIWFDLMAHSHANLRSPWQIRQRSLSNFVWRICITTGFVPEPAVDLGLESHNASIPVPKLKDASKVLENSTVFALKLRLVPEQADQSLHSRFSYEIVAVISMFKSSLADFMWKCQACSVVFPKSGWNTTEALGTIVLF